MIKGIVFDIQRFSIHDGPGIRTTVFLKGCPLRCFWCHNPESQDPYPELSFTLEKCINCGTCEKVCPEGAIILTTPERVNRNKCTVCGVCADACPAGALELVGKEMTVEEVVEEVKKDRVFYEESGGGVTISGGEPLFQFEFTLELSKRLKQDGFHIAIDTSGCWRGQSEDLKNLLLLAETVDLILYDLKLIDDAKHKFYVGVSNKTIIDNGVILFTKFPHKTLFRYPLVPGINNIEKDLNLLMDLFSNLAGATIELLPYHRLGVGKYAKIGKKYGFEQMPSLSEEESNKIKERLRNSLTLVEIR